MTAESTLLPKTGLKILDKDRASVFEIAQYLCQEAPDELIDVTLELVERLYNQDFQCQLINGLSKGFETGDLTIGDHKATIKLYHVSMIIDDLRPYLDAASTESIIEQKELKLDYHKILLPLQEFSWDEDNLPPEYVGHVKTDVLRNQIMPKMEKAIFSGHSKTIIANDASKKQKIKELFWEEEKKLRIAFAVILHMPQKMFHRWLRAKRNLNHFPPIFNRIPYNGSWGNEWQGYPIIWESNYSGDGVPIQKSFKYCSLPENWQKHYSKLRHTLNFKGQSEVVNENLIHQDLVKEFLDHFHPKNNRLMAMGYKRGEDNQTIISYELFRATIEDEQPVFASEIGKRFSQLNFYNVRIYENSLPENILSYETSSNELKCSLSPVLDYTSSQFRDPNRAEYTLYDAIYSLPVEAGWIEEQVMLELWYSSTDTFGLRGKHEFDFRRKDILNYQNSGVMEAKVISYNRALQDIKANFLEFFQEPAKLEMWGFINDPQKRTKITAEAIRGMMDSNTLDFIGSKGIIGGKEIIGIRVYKVPKEEPRSSALEEYFKRGGLMGYTQSKIEEIEEDGQNPLHNILMSGDTERLIAETKDSDPLLSGGLKTKVLLEKAARVFQEVNLSHSGLFDKDGMFLEEVNNLTIEKPTQSLKEICITEEEKKYLLESERALFIKKRTLNETRIIKLRRLQQKLKEVKPDIIFSNMPGRKLYFLDFIKEEFPDILSGIKIHGKPRNKLNENVSVTSHATSYLTAAGYKFCKQGGEAKFNWVQLLKSPDNIQN